MKKSKTMKTRKTSAIQPVPPDEWERSWQRHWSKVGLPGYELPRGGPGGLGTLDELFEAATLIQCRKVGPFPLILMGVKFWEGFRQWGQTMMRKGVFAREEIGFGRITDSPGEAVDLIRRSLPAAVRERLNPL
jgi:hypothetical protein